MRALHIGYIESASAPHDVKVTNIIFQGHVNFFTQRKV